MQDLKISELFELLYADALAKAQAAPIPSPPWLRSPMPKSLTLLGVVRSCQETAALLRAGVERVLSLRLQSADSPSREAVDGLHLIPALVLDENFEPKTELTVRVMGKEL